MKQTIEIEVPDGKIAVWEDGKVVFKDKLLPKTWQEYAQKCLTTGDDHYIASDGKILRFYLDYKPAMPFNVLPSKRAAEAHLALIQLHQLRDCYRQGWKPNRDDNDHNRWCIKYCHAIGLCISPNPYDSRFLSFRTQELATEFMTNFRDLIEQAGDLI